jgi:hypothetical protein
MAAADILNYAAMEDTLPEAAESAILTAAIGDAVDLVRYCAAGVLATLAQGRQLSAETEAGLIAFLSTEGQQGRERGSLAFALEYQAQHLGIDTASLRERGDEPAKSGEVVVLRNLEGEALHRLIELLQARSSVLTTPAEHVPVAPPPAAPAQQPTPPAATQRVVVVDGESMFTQEELAAMVGDSTNYPGPKLTAETHGIDMDGIQSHSEQAVPLSRTEYVPYATGEEHFFTVPLSVPAKVQEAAREKPYVMKKFCAAVARKIKIIADVDGNTEELAVKVRLKRPQQGAAYNFVYIIVHIPTEKPGRVENIRLSQDSGTTFPALPIKGYEIKAPTVDLAALAAASAG